MSLLPGNQAPPPGRSELLRFFAVTETELQEYKALPVDEAKWRLDHEHRVQQAWADRRRTFLVAECLRPRRKVNGNGRRVRTSTRAVNGIDQSVALNRGLWILAEEMRKLAA